jgi:hypothetical protein
MLDRRHQEALGEFADEAELDAAIEGELSQMSPEEAERCIREFAAEEMPG